MDMRIKTTSYEITPETSRYLDDRLMGVEKLMENDEVARFEIELGRHTGHSRHSDDHWFAEINVVTKGNRFRTVAHAASINAAIDEAKDDILRQIRKYRQLHRHILRKGGNMIKNALRFGRDKEM